ncbi:MAG: surface lipoprotein assembly modifier [Paracoccaceae bacterium]
MTPIARKICVLAGLLLGSMAVAEPVVLNAVELRKLAFTAVQAGFAEDALGYTDALLLRDPDDNSALTIRSQALRALGRVDEAKAAARAAFAGADTDPARFGASMAMAQALSTDGKRTAAQWWLRRAAENAPNPRAEAVAKRDFRYVKSRNPWDVQINASAAPSSNVNNGSRQDRLTLAGLPFEFVIPPGSQALSGFNTGVGVRGTYRFAPTGPDRQTKAVFGVLGQAVTLSSESRAKATGLTGTDFSYAAVEAGLSHRRLFGEAQQTSLSFGGTAGRNWYGGEVLSDYLRVEVGVDRALGQKSAAHFGVTVDRVMRIDSPVQSSDRIEATLGFGHMVGSGDRLTLGVTAGRALSESSEIRNEAVGLNLGWTKAKPVVGVALSAGLSVEQRSYAASRYVTGGREDIRVTASLTMSFDKVDYMGFSPTVDVRATRNRSNAALYDTQDVGITLGIKSSF